MKQIFSDKAPAALGPYCHAIVHGDMVFCSGQIPLDPETMEIDDGVSLDLSNDETGALLSQNFSKGFIG